MWMGSHSYRPEYVEALQQAYTRGGPLEREFYLSPEILNADIDRVWRRHWLYAGHDCEIARPGDWMTWQVGNDTIISFATGTTVSVPSTIPAATVGHASARANEAMPSFSSARITRGPMNSMES